MFENCVVIRINDKVYLKGSDFDAVTVNTPTSEEPHWIITLYKNQIKTKTIWATGQVDVTFED